MTRRWIAALLFALMAAASFGFTPPDEIDAGANVDVRFDDRIGVGTCAKADVLWVKVKRTCVWVGWD